jgi:hypothetical protein
MQHTESVYVALLCGDGQVIALSDNTSSVRVAAGLIASDPWPNEPAVMTMITLGRRAACKAIAAGAV